ncbi:hypothetical protein, partial [Arcticibacter tournemirensis]|uniref:hypothetical protein n=1 Tax=Arcticibacter tournemirensis TaxID=699437 RepID=UPI001F3AC027
QRLEQSGSNWRRAPHRSGRQSASSLPEGRQQSAGEVPMNGRPLISNPLCGLSKRSKPCFCPAGILAFLFLPIFPKPSERRASPGSNPSAGGPYHQGSQNNYQFFILTTYYV